MFAFRLLSPQRHTDCLLSLAQETEHFHNWSDDKWKKTLARGGGNKKRYQCCTDTSGAILYLRALQGHSGRNLIDPSVQHNVIIPDGFFKYIYHVGCAINLHSIINSGMMPGGQNSSRERQTVFFTAVNPMNEDHMDPQDLDLTKLRLASYEHKWKKHQDTLFRAASSSIFTMLDVRSIFIPSSIRD